MDRQFIGHSVADKDGVILSMDRAVCDLLDRPNARIVGRSYLEITCREDAAWNARAVDTMAARAPVTLAKRYVRDDGVLVPAMVEASRLVEPARGALIVGTIFLVRQGISMRIPATLWREARRLRAFAVECGSVLGSDLFSNEGWLILLDLYLAEAEGRSEPAARDHGLPESDRRWLIALERKGLVERPNGPDQPPQLSARGFRAIEELIVSTATSLDP